MKETFKVFKFDDGKYFIRFHNWGIEKSDDLLHALWIGNGEPSDELRNLKGKLVTVTITDEEDLSNKTIKINARAISPQKMLKKTKLKGKYTEKDMANLMGVGKSTVHDWLNGKHPSKEYLEKIYKLCLDRNL